MKFITISSKQITLSISFFLVCSIFASCKTQLDSVPETSDLLAETSTSFTNRLAKLVASNRLKLISNDNYDFIRNRHKATRISGFQRWSYVFSENFRHQDGRENLSQVIAAEHEVLKSQVQILKKYENDYQLQQTRKDKNAPEVNVALFTIAKNVAFNISRIFPKHKEKAGQIGNQLIEAYGIVESANQFSGLVFFDVMKTKMSDPRFQEQVISLGHELMECIEKASSGIPLTENVFDLALKITKNNVKDAITLLGLLTSRDALITRYLKHFKIPNTDVRMAFGSIPLLVRLAADLDRFNRNSKVDTFSIPNNHSMSSRRNYYIWSSALAAQILKERLQKLGIKHSSEIIGFCIKQFVLAYKTLRSIAKLNWIRTTTEQASELKGRFEDLFYVSKDIEIALDNYRTIPSVDKNFDTWVDEILPKEILGKNREKIDVLRHLYKNRSIPSKKIYFIYYDMGASSGGLSHARLLIDGIAYEIHNFIDKKSNSFLRERPFLEGMRDSRRGFLPTNIVEIELTDNKQKQSIIDFLRAEAGQGFKYSMFNKLFSQKGYNCAGILYEALRFAGVPLAAQQKTDALPIGIMNKILNQSKVGDLAGRIKIYGEKQKFWQFRMNVLGWKQMFGKIFLSSRSKSTPFQATKDESHPISESFKNSIGKDFLHAEQVLVDKLPIRSNLRQVLGVLFKSFRNAPEIPKEYLPASQQEFHLTCVLIPAENIELEKSQHSNLDQVIVNVEGRKYVRLFIHPNEVKHYEEFIRSSGGLYDLQKWVGTPSSSLRSVFVKKDGEYFDGTVLKLSMNEVFGGSRRVIEKYGVTRGRIVSDLMKEIHDHSAGTLMNTGKKWDFMPEYTGVIIKDSELGGYLVRQSQTYPDHILQIPGYALAAIREGKDNYMTELFKKSKYTSKTHFALNEFVLPLIELHKTLSINNGITTELHQQNVVYQFHKENGRLEKIIVRDMDGNWIDHSLRTHKLHKSIDHLTDLSFKDQAERLLYADAPHNHLLSYLLLREFTFVGILKEFLSKKEIKDVVKHADLKLFDEFHKQHPEYKRPRNLYQYEKALKNLHNDTVSEEERAIYQKFRRIGPLAHRFWRTVTVFKDMAASAFHQFSPCRRSEAAILSNLHPM